MPDVFVPIKDGDLLAVRQVVEQSETTFSISAYSTIGLTPLGAAIYYGKTDIIKFLLEQETPPLVLTTSFGIDEPFLVESPGIAQ